MKLKTALLFSHKISKDLKSNFVLNSAIFLSVFILFFSSSIIHGFDKELRHFYQKIPEVIYVQDLQKQYSDGGQEKEQNLNLLNLNYFQNKYKEETLLSEKKITKEPIAFAIVDYQQLMLKQNDYLKPNEIILPSSFRSKNNQNNNISNAGNFIDNNLESDLNLVLNQTIQLTYLMENDGKTNIQDEEFTVKGYVQNDLLSKNMKFGYIANPLKTLNTSNVLNYSNDLFNKELVFLYDNINKHQDLLLNKQIIFKKSDIDEDFKDIDVLKTFIYLLGFLLLIIASLNIHSTVNYFIMTKK